VQTQPESVLVNNNFAWLYMEKAVKAYKLTEGNSVNITLNYIEGLIANERRDEARKLLKKTPPQSEAKKAKMKTLLDMG